MTTENPTPDTSDDTPGRPSFLDEILSASNSERVSPVVPAVTPPVVGGVTASGASLPPTTTVVPSPVASVVGGGVTVTPQVAPSPVSSMPTIPPQNTLGESVAVSVPPIVAVGTPVSPQVAPTSMLDQIVLSAATAPASPGGIPPVTPPPVLPKKKPVTLGQILQMIGGLFFVSLIFFGSFLAYVVFNPDQARFFINFGINPSDVASLLSQLVNGIFGSLSFALSVVFAYSLFKVYLSKGAPKKRALYIVLSLFVGILLFSNIAFWAFLFDKIGASDFVRPSGGVIVYDNDLALSKEFKTQAELASVSDLIGPITIKYDLSSDVLFASKSLDIEGFYIDCGNGGKKHEGSDPGKDSSITCLFDKSGNFTPTGYYRGKDRVTREPKRVDIAFDEVKVIGVVEIQKVKSTTVFDATELKNIGNIKWRLGPKFDAVTSEDAKYSVREADIDQYICLEIQTPRKRPGDCERVFKVKSKNADEPQANMEVTQDPSEPSKFILRLTDIKVKDGLDVDEINWYIDNNLTSQGKGEIFEKNFTEYYNHTVTAVIQDTEGNKGEIIEKVEIKPPLQLLKKGNDSLLKVLDESGNNLIENTFDINTKSYRINNIQIPSKITFDATDITIRNEGYELGKVLWKIADDQVSGNKVDYDFVEEIRYEVLVTYVFINKITKAETQVGEKIVIEGKSKEIVPSLLISSLGNDSLDNLFATVDVKFDASASKVRSGKISQFIYDFGEGKPPSEGEGVKIYRYTIPGEYTVKLTVVKTTGEKESTSRNIIIKEIPRKLELSSSVSKGTIGKTVEFNTVGTVGQIEFYSWDFGDGTPPLQEPNAVHIFEKAGTYNVKLSATYADGTIRNAEMDFDVGAE